MKKTLYIFTFLVLAPFYLFSQIQTAEIEVSKETKIVEFQISKLFRPLANGRASLRTTEEFFPTQDGQERLFVFSPSKSLSNDVFTINAISKDNSVKLRLTLIENNYMSGVLHTAEGYFFIEPLEGSEGKFKIYPNKMDYWQDFECTTLDKEVGHTNSKNRVQSSGSFPFGSELRKYRFAAATTSAFVNFYGGKAKALSKVIEIMNIINFIYETEAAITFELIPETLNTNLLFLTGEDPFVPDPSGGASAVAAQTGFNILNTNGSLSYSKYDIGHVFHIKSGSNASWQGQAGGIPCNSATKARAWSQWSEGAGYYFISAIANIIIHEMGHQFGAPHTFNANSQNCNSQWSSQSAVEPGSGSTLMGYGKNCYSPNNYVLVEENLLNYFHTKSLEFIQSTVSLASCSTNIPTGNTPPVANAGPDITIPKETPFKLSGIADGSEGKTLSFTWDQIDVATQNDKGAFGDLYTGVGGYTAVNSTTAPLFRSYQSSYNPSRSFPDVQHIIKYSNYPPANIGEALPKVARGIKFRFTVRDNHEIGGVDSDEIMVSVSSSGPFRISSHNTSTSLTPGGGILLTWDVNGTYSLANNVEISLSIDGGMTFPYLLSDLTPNDGSQSLILPSHIPNTTRARIKIVGKVSSQAEFFDINDADLIVETNCTPNDSFISPDGNLSGTENSNLFNLGLNFFPGNIFYNKSKRFTYNSVFPIAAYSNNKFEACTFVNNNYQGVLVKFMVTKSGNYTLIATDQNSSGQPLTIYNSSSLSCNSFIKSNIYVDGNLYWWNNNYVYLDEGITYYMVIINGGVGNEVSVQFGGPGEIMEVTNLFLGFDYTFIAVSELDNKVKKVSAASDFRSLSKGKYKIYGLVVQQGFSTNTLVGKTINQVVNLATCKQLSSNFKLINILEDLNNCPASIVLTGIAENGVKKSSTSLTSSQLVTINKNVHYKSGGYILLEPLNGEGFEVQAGAVFLAEVKGCN